MTDITKSVEKDIIGSFPYKFRCRWYGKYDEEFNGIAPTGIDKDESDLTTYDGLSYTKTYMNNINVTRVGALTLSGYIVSGFSAAKYMRLPDAFLPEDNSWSVILKVRTGSSVSTQQYLFGSSTGFFDTIGGELTSGGKFGVGFTSNGSSWDIGWITGTTSATKNTWYWLKLSFTGTEYKFELSTDGETYNLEGSITSSTAIYQNSSTSIIHLGTQGNKSKYWGGQIDLENCEIKIDNSYAWLGLKTACIKLDFSNTVLPWKWDYQKLLKNRVFAVGAYGEDVVYYGDTLNGTITGSVEIDNNKLISGFSSSNYLTAGNNAFATANSWAYVSKFKATTINKYQFFFHRPVAFGLDNSNRMHVWNLPMGDIYSDFTFSADTWYWVKFEFTGEEYNGYYKTTEDGEWIRIINVASTSKVTSSTTPTYIGLNPNNTSEAFAGFIDLKEAHIVINGNEAWRAFPKNYLAGCVNGDEDSGGKYYCYAIDGDERIELRKKTDSVIVAYNTNPRYLGEVSVYDSGWRPVPIPDIPV